MRSPTKDEWIRLEPLLDEAMALPRDTATGLLADACAGDEGLRAWVERFLDGAADDDFPVTLAPEVVANALSFGEEGTPRADARIGPFRIVREIGRGGMGAVYLAERADGQFEQQVALKMVQRGLGAAEMRDRFLRERQILARLDHPNVAHLVDGGITDDGQPWFAMEYVDGEPLDVWCDRRKLGVEKRLALVLSVCDAVQAAHQRLVIHRDLKPSNIMVTREGQVKLLDFGIAKLLQDTDAGLTQTGVRSFTPEYAAPEQWRGDAVTTGSDVYSLGAVLYELLTGARPHQLRGHPETEWAQIVLERAVTTPSSAVTQSAAERSGTTVERLRRRLREDLDLIVLTALRVEPERRYRTIDLFATDLRRHLDGHPIAARADTWRYRTRKFVGRNRVGVGAAALVAMSLVGGTGGIAWQARRAEREAARANAARQFLAGVFRESDPSNARGDSLTAGAMLDRATSRLDSVFAGQPTVKLDLMIALGEIYRNLGRLASADSLVSRAVRLADSVDIDRDRARAATLILLGTVRLEAGDLVSADTLARKGIAWHERASGSDSALGAALAILGAVKRQQYAFAESETAYRRAIGIAEGKEGAPLTLSTYLNDFGVMLLDAGRYLSADSAFLRALALESHRLAPNDPDHALLLMNHALALDYLGEKDSAAVLYEDVLRMQRLNYPNGHQRVAEVLNNLAFVSLDRGRFARADSLFREGLAIVERLYGRDQLGAIIVRNNIARTELLSGQAATAETAFRTVLDDARRVLGESHGYVSQPLHWIGRSLLAQGRPLEARRMLDSALHMAQRTLPPEHERFAEVQAALGAAAMALGDTAAANAALQFALKHLTAAVGANVVEAMEPLLLLARLRAQEGARPAAESLYVRALTTLEKHPWLAWRSVPARREWEEWQKRWAAER